MPIRQKNPVNEVATPTLRSKSPFKWSYPHLNTQRFGEIDPVFVMDTVPNDDIKLAQRSVLNTYTLKAPLLNKVTKHYGFYSVPKCAILPHAWSKIFVNPKKGDDVNGALVNAVIKPTDIADWFSNFVKFFSGSTRSTSDDFFTAFRALILYCYVQSPDSLAQKLRIPFVQVSDASTAMDGSKVSYYLSNVTIDADRTSYLDVLRQCLVTSGISSATCIIHSGDYVSGSIIYNFEKSHGLNSFSDFVDLAFSGAAVTISNISGTFFHGLNLAIEEITGVEPSTTFVAPYSIYRGITLRDENVNIQRLAAYQMVCASFATRDTIDDVYTTELYRQNMESLYIAVLRTVPTFNWNGISIIYDWCSGQIISSLLSVQPISLTIDKTIAQVSYLTNLLYPQKSLRYGDMFNSARTEPFAVGDTDIDVVTNKVSVVDTVYNILKEKFLNLVNNVPNTVAKYSQAVFGVIPDNLPAEPYKLGECSFQIKSNVNINTAQDQGTQQNNLTGMYSGLSFGNHHFNQDEIIIGVSWYVMELPYILNMSPFGFKFDRYDGFLPQLQNIGSVGVDQTILPEGPIPSRPNFGYLPNDYEYKQDYGDAVGAFCDSDTLPGWSACRSMVGIDSAISPWFIRPRIAEMDEFYKSLTGADFKYFHFICSDYFEIYAQRPMEYVPTVLGNF